jgi:pyrimidine deaminase RibD-like protein
MTANRTKRKNGMTLIQTVNPVAKALRNPVCKQRIVNSKKVYNRKVRHPVASVDIRF